MIANCVTTAMYMYITLHFIHNFNEYLSVGYMNKNLVVPEKVFRSYAVNRDEPINLTMTGYNCFLDFSTKIIKLENLFKKIQLESINLFEDVKSVNIFPYCIPAEAFTNDEICFKNTEIHNLENLKLENIELGRSTIHKKKNDRFLYVSHKFDELVISGTTDFVDIGNQDKYNTSIFKSNLIIYRDYNNQGFFNLEIPFLEGYSEYNTDKYVAHAIDMQLKSTHDMTFHLPVRGFNGLLELLENEISTPSIFFPENITFGCGFSVNEGSKPHTISINTYNMHLNEHLNYDVFNKVKFVKIGDSYNTQFAITFNKLAFSSIMSVKINEQLVFQENVEVEMKKLHVEVDYLSNRSPMYKLNVEILNGVSVSTESKNYPYPLSPPFYKKLSSCIKATTLYNMEATLVFLKFLEIHPNANTNYATWI
ncbi:PREDICTED: uncharacterized protein LOC107164057 [Diuraphis noxia]|uniref:uncharacterized protein LOC107164057 n=1 Tax=Diuraphis noxia TaxID=143948 RepID=UPI00076381BE|nr:PREDICTED: uncharacterized protein LOC107164057 [Diuraphis noxia]